MSEDALWDNARGKLAPFGRLVRIENRCDLGTPDFFYTLLRRSGWCELKHRPEWPVGKDQPLVLPKLTLDQMTWIEHEHKAGGRVSMLVQVDRDYIFADASMARMIYQKELTRRQIIDDYPTRINTHLHRKWILDWLTK